MFTEPEPGLFALTSLGQTLVSGQPGSMHEVAIMFMETRYWTRTAMATLPEPSRDDKPPPGRDIR